MWRFLLDVSAKACILIVGNLIVILLSGVSAVKAARENNRGELS